jgi:hypothetical protein
VTKEPESFPVTIRNEFAMVEVSVVAGGSGFQLKIEDVPGAVSVLLDALELEGLCWLSADERRQLLNPETRWKEGDSSAPVPDL